MREVHKRRQVNGKRQTNYIEFLSVTDNGIIDVFNKFYYVSFNRVRCVS